MVIVSFPEVIFNASARKKKRKEAGGLGREKAGKFPQNQMTVSEQCGKIAVKIRQQILRGGLQL